jgi:dual specificity MAP kinase phosphatase
MLWNFVSTLRCLSRLRILTKGVGHWERMEMCKMSEASEISNNVWIGSTADLRRHFDRREARWGVQIESSDLAQMPLPEHLQDLLQDVDHSTAPVFIEFPGSGTISPTNWSRHDVDGIIDTCRWIYAVANGQFTEEESHDADGDHRMTPTKRIPRKILIHCTDGYTETSLLALAYVMFSECLPVHDSWIKLHTEKKRNFFAYDKDLAFLRYIESTLLDAAARNKDQCFERPRVATPEWVFKMDGSLPSRVLPYMYLGNLLHANNCGLLQALGIKRVLSIGEEVVWSDEEREAFGRDKVMMVRDLQDNGCDPLEYQFRSCLEFIGKFHTGDGEILASAEFSSFRGTG